jgi:hypothetical protein
MKLTEPKEPIVAMALGIAAMVWWTCDRESKRE